MEYTAWDGSGWWMTYTITAQPGEPMFQDGADAYFEISLYSFGPSFYEWSYPRELGAGGEGEESGAGGEALRPARGSERMVSGGFVLELEYGLVKECFGTAALLFVCRGGWGWLGKTVIDGCVIVEKKGL